MGVGRNIVVAAAAVLLLGCESMAGRNPGPVPAGAAPPVETLRLPLAYHPEERELLRRERPEWGLALSGGGLRSALFSIGVLKALHEQKALGRFDMISTVSGGGYAGYWLYADALAHPSERKDFGGQSLAPDHFPRRLCELITRGNFVTYPRGIGAAIKGSSVKLYENSLLRTFGRDERAFGGKLTLGRFRAPMGAGIHPYWVLGATSDEGGYANAVLAPDFWPGKLFEFSPVLHGNPFAGQRRWGGEFPARRAAAISGAAQGMLKQEIPNPAPDNGGPTVRLWDGGKSENLGAIALIRRGARNIVVVDAEHDPDYRFGAYRKLSNNLKLHGATLRIGDIEAMLKAERTKLPLIKSAFEGTVSFSGYDPDQPPLRIIYLKMAMPKTLMPKLERNGEEFRKGRAAEASFEDALNRSAEDGRWQCARLRFRFDGMAAWSAYHVRTYADFLPRTWRARLLDAVGYGGAKIHFPQYSTLDQSYYTDQAKALIGLGYLQALDGLGTSRLPRDAAGAVPGRTALGGVRGPAPRLNQMQPERQNSLTASR